MNHRYFFVFLLYILISCGQSNFDPATPDGAHNLFVQAFADKNYKEIYTLLTEETKQSFDAYLSTTRKVADLIREKYPESMRVKALDDLSIPFNHSQFTYHDIELGKSQDEIFAGLCEKMFADNNGKPSLMQRVGTKIQSVAMENSGKAIITTLAGEKLTYLLESDHHWRTGEIFGGNFKQLVLVSRQNLEITQRNIELLSQ